MSAPLSLISSEGSSSELSFHCRITTKLMGVATEKPTSSSSHKLRALPTVGGGAKSLSDNSMDPDLALPLTSCATSVTGTWTYVPEVSSVGRRALTS